MRVDIPFCSILTKDDGPLGMNSFCTSNTLKTIVPHKNSTFNNMILEVHLSRGFCFSSGDLIFPAAPRFLCPPGEK